MAARAATMSTGRRLALLGVLVAALLLGHTVSATGLAVSAAAESNRVYEVHHVPTVDGAVIRVEVTRDTAFDEDEQPVILTYSPYNSIAEPTPADDSLADRYAPQGYARAVADVLGTRGSTGCWDYGGQAEQQSGVDVVQYLAGLDWSNGKVAMTGGSYNGTTATMVAATGIPELASIVPIAGISRWYGYAFGNGVRYFLNSEVPTDEGFDTPLAFDVGFARTVAADPMGEHFADTLVARTGECDAAEHNEEAYDRTPDYDEFWLDRDYRKDADRIRAAVLIAHGWRDFNVKQEEAVELFREIPVDDPATQAVEGAPFKLLYMTQGAHSGGTNGDQWQPLLDRFFERTLKGRDNGVEHEGPVFTEGRTSSGTAPMRVEGDYPLPSTEPSTLWLRAGYDVEELPGLVTPLELPGLGEDGALSSKPDFTPATASYIEAGASTEELDARSGQYFLSLPLEDDTRLVGSAVLDTWVRASSEGMHLAPVLVDVDPSGDVTTIERGFQHIDYRDGLASAEPNPGEWVRVRVSMLPQDYTVEAGHRVGLFVQSSNTVWAVPGNPGAVDIATGKLRPGIVGSRLILPTIDDEAAFTRP